MAKAWKRNSKSWKIAPPFDGADQLARQISASPLVASILHNRGLTNADACRAFLSPSANDLHDPQTLAGTQEASKKIADAISRGDKIVIYGDYDVDGITAVAILYACMKLLGATPDFYVPHRLEEGYGLNDQALDKIIADGAKLLVTVDCGISAADAVARAKSAGLDVIITDHHTPPPKLPDATIVHPAVPAGAYPNPNLSGAGVAFKLAWQLARQVSGKTRVDDHLKKFLHDATCLACLGTIADVVPLTGENRVLATFGLKWLATCKMPGMAALLESSSLTAADISETDIGFKIGPRLNACGRMGHAHQAIELLTNASPERAKQIAADLTKKNSERQKIERQIAQHAAEMVEAAGMDKPECGAIVLASEEWHGGVIGIVASRMVEKFGKPAVLIAINGDGRGQGSGRSVPGFDLAGALRACSEKLLSHGGHPMAGGLKIDRANIDAFTAEFIKFASENFPAGPQAQTLDIDAETTIAALGYPVVELLTKLAPFGQGNPTPTVVIRGCKIIRPPRRMGQTGQHVDMVIGQGSATMRAVGFGMGDLADSLAGINTIDIAAQPVLNTFNGRTNIELQLVDAMWE